MANASHAKGVKLDLELITGDELSSVSSEPDQRTSGETRKAEDDMRRVAIEDADQNRKERKKYARRIFKLICFWISGLFIVLLLQGFGSLPFVRFSLPSSVLLAAIGSTTVNVLGIFYIVTHYLFPSASAREKPKLGKVAKSSDKQNEVVKLKKK